MPSGRFIKQIRRARQMGKLPIRFTASDVKVACPGWAYNTYSTFLPKHRVGNLGGVSELFVQHRDGTYSLVEDSGEHQAGPS